MNESRRSTRLSHAAPLINVSQTLTDESDNGGDDGEERRDRLARDLRGHGRLLLRRGQELQKTPLFCTHSMFYKGQLIRDTFML